MIMRFWFKKIVYFFIPFTLLFSTGVAAQDMFYSQFNYAPLYMNPAFAGCAKNYLRMSGVAKVQWYNLYRPFRYLSAGADMSIYDGDMRNIVNLGATVDHSSKGFLNRTSVSGVLGRSFGIVDEDCAPWFLSIALKAGFNIGRVNPDQFLFIDQLDQTGFTGNPSEIDLFTTNNTRTYFDMSSGAIYCFKNLMIGISVMHLNEPNVSFVGKPEDGRLPRKYCGHVSWIYDRGDIRIKPTFIAQFQGQSSMMTAGALFDFKQIPIELGLWYRNNTSLSYNNAISLGFTWKWGQGRSQTSPLKEWSNSMGVSYDGEINKPGIRTTYGSMELGIQHNQPMGKDIICPTSDRGKCRNYQFPWQFF